MEEVAIKAICSVKGCNNKHKAKGLCLKHYQHQYRQEYDKQYNKKFYNGN